MFVIIGPQFQCLEGWDQNSNVQNRGPEFQCLEGQDKNSNVWKDRVRIPMFIKIGLEFHSYEK